MVATQSYSVAVSNDAFASTMAQVLVVLALGLVLESNYLFKIALGHWRQRGDFDLKLEERIERLDEVLRDRERLSLFEKSLSQAEHDALQPCPILEGYRDLERRVEEAYLAGPSRTDKRHERKARRRAALAYIMALVVSLLAMFDIYEAGRFLAHLAGYQGSLDVDTGLALIAFSLSGFVVVAVPYHIRA
ncbi:MAG: hypothetical protein EHM13_03030, partial [Acidobacteria bacterium]